MKTLFSSLCQELSHTYRGLKLKVGKVTWVEFGKLLRTEAVEPVAVNDTSTGTTGITVRVEASIHEF